MISSIYTQYYNEGINSYKSGLSLADNPYVCDNQKNITPKAVSWNSGWLYAKRTSK